MILARAAPLPTERVPLELAAGLALAEDVVARVDLPERDNSGMDGYAVRSADLAAAAADRPVSLRVADRIAAGDLARTALQPGESARIFTGAPVPPGADAVVMQEDVERRGD